MRYIVIGLALIGFAAGATVRLKVLVSLLVLLFAGSIIFSVSYGCGFLNAALTIFTVQVVVQAGYFVGSVVRSILARIDGGRWAL
jgi:hypothetical protein